MSERNLSAAPGGKNEVDFSGGWNEFWDSLTKGVGADSIINLMSVIGVAFVVVALIAWAVKKATGKNVPGGQGGIGGALILGAVLCAPSVVIPMILTLFDLVANAFVSVFTNSTS